MRLTNGVRALVTNRRARISARRTVRAGLHDTYDAVTVASYFVQPRRSPSQ